MGTQHYSMKRTRTIFGTRVIEQKLRELKALGLLETTKGM